MDFRPFGPGANALLALKNTKKRSVRAQDRTGGRALSENEVAAD
jgi:hypothetical protein